MDCFILVKSYLLQQWLKQLRIFYGGVYSFRTRTYYTSTPRKGKKITKQGKLIYDLYASPPYLIPSSRCTHYLLVEEIRVIENGYILFNQKIDTRIRKRKEKAIVRNTQLYLPIPSAFKGITKADQQLRSLNIILVKHQS